MFGDTCIRCGENPGMDEEGYCAYCHGDVQLEVREGFRRLRDYLAAWARFAEWCAAHEAAR